MLCGGSQGYHGNRVNYITASKTEEAKSNSRVLLVLKEGLSLLSFTLNMNTRHNKRVVVAVHSLPVESCFKPLQSHTVEKQNFIVRAEERVECFLVSPSVSLMVKY